MDTLPERRAKILPGGSTLCPWVDTFMIAIMIS